MPLTKSADKCGHPPNAFHHSPLTRWLPLVSPFGHHRKADGVCPEATQPPVLTDHQLYVTANEPRNKFTFRSLSCSVATNRAHSR